MVTVVFDSMGEAVRLALVADEYVGGGLAVLLLDATDPRSEGYMAEWGVLTASVPAAAEWCRGRGNIAIDADTPTALLEALEAAGAVRMADALANAGGWAAVRIGFGDAETIDCETGRTVYATGAE